MLEDNLKNLYQTPSPAYVLDEAELIQNLKNLADVKERAGCKIILALKSYALFPSFNIIKPYLDGTTASGIYEAKLGNKHFGKEVHVYSPAYDDAEIEALIPIANHIIFNSPSQLKKYAPQIKQQAPRVHIGLRINPEIQEVSTDIYNPCAPCSRMGSVESEIDDESWQLIDGLHFHTLCESMDSSSTRLIDYVEQNFAKQLKNLKWVNFGGGHYINHPSYNKENLINNIQQFKQKFPNLEVILEPGGTVVYNTGYLVSTVLDIIKNQKDIAILDTSATAHMPDVLEMPYRPNLFALAFSSSLQGGEADAAIHPNEQESSSDGLLQVNALRNDKPEKILPLPTGGVRGGCSGDDKLNNDKENTMSLPDNFSARKIGHDAHKGGKPEGEHQLINSRAIQENENLDSPRILFENSGNDKQLKSSPPAGRGSWRGEEAYDQGANPSEKPYNYLLTGRTCLTGDIIGEYSFNTPLQIGDRIIFTDMMQYSFVKNTTFNAIPLPELGILKTDGTYQTYRKFTYEDFEGRMG